MQEITEKEKYELWWEYLLESKKFLSYCKFKRKNRNESEKKRPSIGMIMTYDFFGDIFENSFDEWWKNKKEKDLGIGTMEYSRQQAQHEFNSTVRRFVESHGREPSLDEFRDVFIEHLFDYFPASFMIRVYFHPTKSIKDLNDQFKKIVAEKRKQPNIQNWETELKKGWLPIVGRFRYDELKRYLEVYRLKKSGMKIDEILEKMDPHVTRNREDFYQDIRHANTILKNVEDGCFPGEYYLK